MRAIVTGLMLALAAAAPVHAQPMDRETFIRMASSVLRVEAVRAQGGFSLGSGVALTSDTVVTNCHVTRDAIEVRVLRAGKRWPARTQRIDARHDLCLLQVPGLDAPALPLGPPGGLALSQHVDAYGYTGGLGLQVSTGTVIGLHRHDGALVIQSSNAFNSGASGGALLDEQHRLVGILTFRLPGGAAHYYSAPADWLRALLDDGPGSRWQAVGPLSDEPQPYWAQPIGQQPLFLQAAVLERSSRWGDLIALSNEWTRNDARDAEPWYWRGVGLMRLERLPQARDAFECALRIMPAYTPALERLADLPARPSDAVSPTCDAN